VANRFTKIVGGQETEQHEYPWQVGLMRSEFSSRPFCGGSIISNKEILTAAHCTAEMKPSNIWVMVGGHNMGDSTTKEERVEVCAIKDHPDYNDRSLNNDLSILVLCKELKLGKEVSPVCLPVESGRGEGYEGQEAIVSGWGTTSSGGSQPDTLQEVGVVTMSNRQCASPPNVYPASQITDAMICAAAKGKDSCQGDSGGPLVTNMGPTSGKSYYLIGVVSWGKGCAEENAPGVYARVTQELDWINNNLEGDKCFPAPTV